MIKLLYVTFGSEEEAASVARKLLAEKLIACANIVGGSTSIYRWENGIKQEREVIMLAKTTAAQAQRAIERTQELHSYEIPCILALAANSALPEFTKWVEGEIV